MKFIKRLSLLVFTLICLATVPGTWEFFFNTGIDKINQNDFETAIHNFNRAIEVKDDLYDAYFNRGYAKLRMGDYVGAAEDFEVVYKADPNNINVIMGLGGIYEQLGDNKKAVEIFSKGIEIEQGEADLFIGRGLAYYNQGDFEKALEDFDRAIGIDDKNADAYSNRASAKLNLGDISGSLSDYEQALSIDPNHPVAKQNLAVVQRAIAETAEADSAGIYLDKAREAYNKGQYSLAIRLATHTITINNSLIEAYIIRGSSYLAEQAFAPALTNFNAAEELGSREPYIYYGIGVAHFYTEDIAGSIKAFDKAIELDEANADFYIMRGQAHTELGNADKAISDFTSAISIDNTKSKAYHYRGNSYMREKMIDDAYADYMMSVELNPHNPVYLSNLSTACISLYREDMNESHLHDARDYAMEAYNLSDGQFGLYNLASSEALLNNAESALRHLRELLDMGYDTPQSFIADSNFENLHDNPEFRSIVGWYAE